MPRWRSLLLLLHYRDIVSIDFCKPVIEAMQKAHADKPGMQWKVRQAFFSVISLPCLEKTSNGKRY